MKGLLSCVFFFSLVLTIRAQPETNNWFFSNYQGLNFSTGSPVNLPGGQIFTSEGASVISDKTGQLLFYTDGIRVWNKSHVIMANGLGLAGGTGSSMQACVIVPKTADEKQYYIFTADEEGRAGGLQYSIVDMSLNNGLGAVIIKNQPLVAPTSEKITVIRHCNKKDYWILTLRYGTNAYYAFLATENGVQESPVISYTGSVIRREYGTMAGQLKSSPDGKRIIAMSAGIGAELSDFDNQTGVVSNTVEIFSNVNAHHSGAEFSANSKILYLAIHAFWYQPDFKRYSGIYQYDLSLPTITQVVNSKYEVFRYDFLNAGSLMQRANNGKIYINQYDRNFLSVINNPEVFGPGCDYLHEGFFLNAKNYGSLPNFINDYGTSLDTFRVMDAPMCVGSPISFSYSATGDVTSLVWDFDDPGSGLLNSAFTPETSHTFSTAGNYNITLIKYSSCGNDTLKKRILIGDVHLELGDDTLFCEKSSYLIQPQVSGVSSYNWQDGSTLPDYIVTKPGLYWLQVVNSETGCIKRDSITIGTKPSPTVSLGNNVTICPEETILLNAFNDNAVYKWQDNSTAPAFLVRNAGTYWVEAELNGCKSSDTVTISRMEKPAFTLGPDQFLCPGLSLTLSTGLTGMSFYWNNGSTAPTFQVSGEGKYYVAVTNSCGTSTDTVIVKRGNCTIYIPNAFTPNNDGKNDEFRIFGTGLVNEFELRIFDRYGQSVFYTSDKNGYWDGRLKGELLPGGVYVYMLKYTEVNSPEKKVLKGTLLLIR